MILITLGNKKINAKANIYFSERPFFAESDSAIRFTQLALDFTKFCVEIPKKCFLMHFKIIMSPGTQVEFSILC